MKFGFGVIAVLSLALLSGLVFALSWGGSSSSPVFSSSGGGAQSQPLTIYCAAGLRTPVEAVAKAYREEFGVPAEFVFRGSGALLSDLRVAGAGDVYIAASMTYLDDARNQYQLVDEVFPIASQRAVILVAQGNPKKIKGFDDLSREGVRVSLADPGVAAIARAAKKAIGEERWAKAWKAKLVSVDTVNRVANDVSLNAADAGIVWDATAQQYDNVEVVRVPEFDAAPKQIAAGVLSDSKQPTRALHFLRFMTARDRGLKSFQKLGYEVIEGDRWADKPEIMVFAGGLNRPAIQQTIRDFEKREGVSVLDSYNGCGILVGQIRTGSVPDLYFSCDTSFMTQVSEEFPHPVNVSATDMVIITSKKNEHGIKTMKDLAQSGLKVGVCHPQKSALGALTKRLLEKNSLWDQVFVNVKDTPATADRLVEHVVIGSLEAAIVYRANTTMQKDKLTVLSIDDVAARATQPIAVSGQSDFKQLTSRLMENIRSAESMAKFKKLGFDWLGDPTR